MISLIKRLLQIRIIRYGLVGGVGIPILDAALFCFTHLLAPLPFIVSFSLSGQHFSADLRQAVALVCAFEVSNIINFVLNQFFTYNEQSQHIHWWEWPRRIAKGQLASLSAMLLSIVVALVLIYAFHVNEYLATPAGTIIAFFYNFFISNKLVFRPTTPAPTPKVAEEMKVKTTVEITPE
ncbi:MAG: GtrA family protein [Ktedonobacteraceae bacterium]